MTRQSPMLAACMILAAGPAEIPAAAPDDARQPDAEVARVNLANPSQFARTDEAVRIGFATLGVDGRNARSLKVMEGADPLAAQVIDSNGDGDVDSLIFLADFGPAEHKDFLILDAPGTGRDFPKRTQAEVSIKQGGHWDDAKYTGGAFVNVDALVPPPQYTDHSEYIRYEGPGIESDRIAYRIYLDWRNGFDIFGKKITGLVLQDVGLDGYDSYHEPADWGMDVLKVGDAVGVGGYGFWDGEKVVRVSDVDQRSVRILDNGPVFSQLELRYEGWKAGDRSVDLAARLSMSAGSRLVHTQVEVSKSLPNLAVGIVKHPGTKLLQGDLEISGHAWTWVASWGRQSLADDHLGMLLLFRKQARKEQTQDEYNYVSVLQPLDGRVEYYFGAVWAQEPDGSATEEAFTGLLEAEAEKLTLPLRMQLQTARSAREKAREIDAEAALEWSQRLAESELDRLGEGLSFGGFDTVGKRTARWSYTTGLLMQAMDELSAATGDPKFADFARRTIDSYLTGDGGIRTYQREDYNIDDINSGKMLLRLYERFGDDRYRAAADLLRAQLADHPRTSEGAFWHKQRYPWQLWLDGVYMGMPFLAHHAVLSGDAEGLEEAANEFRLVRKHLKDSDTGLYFHAWDEKKQQSWADPETGLSRFFWSRGMGWYAMALVDVLDFIPEERPDLREPIIATIREFAESVLPYQAWGGGWYQITDRPGAVGNYPEASGSSMFVYMLAKAVNRGYLGAGYRDLALRAYTGLISRFVNVEADGKVSIMNVCQVAGLGYGRDGSYRYYMSEPVISNDPKGVAPFIMAGLQVAEMLGSRPG